jgi:hypothetical protein
MPEATHSDTMRRHEACLAFSSAAKSGSTSRFFSSALRAYAALILHQQQQKGRGERPHDPSTHSTKSQGSQTHGEALISISRPPQAPPYLSRKPARMMQPPFQMRAHSARSTPQLKWSEAALMRFMPCA